MPQEIRHWLLSHWLRVRLYAVLAALLLAVLGLGIVGFARLSDVNRASEVIRNHWLRDTRILGDLSNFMSDYRAAEATFLLSRTPADGAAAEREIGRLQATVTASQSAYGEIGQDAAESALYSEFSRQWANYLTVAARVVALGREERMPEAVALYNSDSRRTFDRSSDILSRLTDQTVVKARRDSDAAAATYARARTMLASSMLLAAILLAAVILYVIRRVMTPLVDLVACMHRLAGHQAVQAIPCVGRGDEIGEMARAVAVFRDNALALAASQRRLIEQAAALEQGLENERRLTAQQRDFVSMTSHEFRTPLTIIDGHAQRLIKTRERVDPSEVCERGERIRGAVQRITNLMDGLLGASGIVDGQAVFHPGDVDPRALLHDAAQAHRDAVRGVRINESFTSLPAAVCGDAKLLFHLFSNLISNAVKYSPAGSPIDISAAREGDCWVVEVRDQGIGIPAKDRSRLFERFFRGSNATGIAGTGVGLHLVAMVAAMHGGEVCVESLEGVGSRFVVRLPIDAGAPGIRAQAV